MLIIIHAHYQLTAELWISIVLSLFKRTITISWSLLLIICVDFHPCPWSTTAEFLLYYLYLKDNHISWPLLWIICVVDYHPCSWSTNSWIYIVLSLWSSCVHYFWKSGLKWPKTTSEAIEVTCFEVTIKRIIQLWHPKKYQSHTHGADLLFVHGQPLRPLSSQCWMPIKSINL